ncbi:conserved hypothetical protein [Frankia canadensis]|uniref:Uncharacterized protein n=1 Tax=Frankia canadensis TaxID=1836972 RepID=A0A2I2KZM0_9ACTN|nr:hypothetical protein [Frankia canadensis]SNQ51111.1 conserved hypothetical protein [Frankia canadensis]SOU58401.1 conserved hypothetical protein [Frankia canadensis]
MDKIIKYAAIAFVIFFVVTAPNSAAGIVHRAFGWLHSWGNGVSEFVSNTVG